MKSDHFIDGLPLESAATDLIGQVIDPHSHFIYADQGIAAAKELMKELDLDQLPLVDRNMRVVEVLARDFC